MDAELVAPFAQDLVAVGSQCWVARGLLDGVLGPSQSRVAMASQHPGHDDRLGDKHSYPRGQTCRAARIGRRARAPTMPWRGLRDRYPLLRTPAPVLR